MRVTVDIPDREWWRIASVADLRGQKVDEMVAQIALGLAHPDPVRRLHAVGMTDAQIASETGLLLGTIAARRRKLGLPPNKKTSTIRKREAA